MWRPTPGQAPAFHQRPVQETAEQAAARVLRRENARKARLLQEEKRKIAEARAEALLLHHLSPQQVADLKAKKCFYVFTKDGHRYRVDRGSHGNVKKVDAQDRIIESLCIQPVGVPIPDILLAQKLMLECNEEEFRRIANIVRRRAA